MAGRPARAAPVRTTLEVCAGKAEKAVGRLVFVKDGHREFSQFAYSDAWLSDPAGFDISPDLVRRAGYQLRKPPAKDDTRFFLALADTEPDAWGRRVIALAHVYDGPADEGERVIAPLRAFGETLLDFIEEPP